MSNALLLKGYIMFAHQPLAMTFLGIEIHSFELNTWKVIGLSGSLVFALRFIIQAIASEKAQKSVIPFGFWECSLVGCILSLSYFAIYRHDSVGVIQNLIPLPIYLRNLYFRYRKEKPVKHSEFRDVTRTEVESQTTHHS